MWTSSGSPSRLLRQSEPAIERLFERLEEEPNALVRFRIMRIAGQLRGAAIHSAVKRLDDGRWYVVRNACLLLGEMRDPDMIVHLAPVLRHADERVQRAAFQALQKSRLAECVRAYADALAEHGSGRARIGTRRNHAGQGRKLR